MSLSLRPGAILLAALVGSALSAQEHHLPRFEDYPVLPRDVHRPASPRLEPGTWETLRWGDEIHRQAHACWRFASNYCLILLRAGVPLGFRLVIMGFTDGRLFWTPVDAEFGIEGRFDSALLIVDGEKTVRSYQQLSCADSAAPRGIECAGAMTYFYVWDGTNLTAVDSVAIGPLPR